MSKDIEQSVRRLSSMAYEDGFSQSHQGFQRNQSAREDALKAILRNINAMSEALVWYEEQVRLCRKLPGIPDGESARNALSRDGGERARKALTGSAEGVFRTSENTNEVTGLLEALKKAKETIRALHGPVAWEIYDRSSPEMSAINAALSSESRP